MGTVHVLALQPRHKSVTVYEEGGPPPPPLFSQTDRLYGSRRVQSMTPIASPRETSLIELNVTEVRQKHGRRNDRGVLKGP